MIRIFLSLYTLLTEVLEFIGKHVEKGEVSPGTSNNTKPVMVFLALVVGVVETGGIISISIGNKSNSIKRGNFNIRIFVTRVKQ